ncbi:methyltransferase [Methylotenera versatilis]|uniref:methyltransferase n=1 Tax=Methylotenera versatilis TaxID=1055487 RepID=UPI000646C282|nr:class I SAM-dependent methyltransferase [Methylotenera versatilis]
MTENLSSNLTITWQEKGKPQQAVWQSEANAAPPKNIVVADDTMKADEAYKLACEGTGFLYKGDFQNAKQLLQAVTKRVDRKPIKPAATMLEAFHQHRARQIQRANITNKILIELNHGNCDLKRAPDVKEAVAGALIVNPKLDKVPAKMVLSLRELLGMNGAQEWRKKGVFIDALQANIHAHYGVYSPIRGEYLDLINTTSLGNAKTAFDIGTGTGVIAAILVTRGIKAVIATDSSPRALNCAADNVGKLNLKPYITVEQANLFPSGHKKADLIVCNPPWLPAKANAPIEHAIYDPNSQMLKGFLNGVKAHLNDNGEAWLILSDLAEHLGLRTQEELLKWIADAGLSIMEKLDIAPKHAKSSDQSDPLYAARVKEITSLYRLK